MTVSGRASCSASSSSGHTRVASPRSWSRRSCGSATDWSSSASTRPARHTSRAGTSRLGSAADCRRRSTRHGSRSPSGASSLKHVRAGPAARTPDDRHASSGAAIAAASARGAGAPSAATNARAGDARLPRAGGGVKASRATASTTDATRSDRISDGGRPSGEPETGSARHAGGIAAASSASRVESVGLAIGIQRAFPSTSAGRKRPRARRPSDISHATASQRMDGAGRTPSAVLSRASTAASGSSSITGTRQAAIVRRPRPGGTSAGSHGDGSGTPARVGSRSVASVRSPATPAAAGRACEAANGWSPRRAAAAAARDPRPTATASSRTTTNRGGRARRG